MNQNYTQKKNRSAPSAVAPWRSSKACLRYGIKDHKEYASSTFQDGPKMVPRWPQAPGDHRRMLSEKHAPKRRLFHLLCLHRCLRYDTARPEPFSIKLRKFKATKESQANPNLYLWSRLLRDGADSRIQSNHICLQAQPVAR